MSDIGDLRKESREDNALLRAQIQELARAAGDLGRDMNEVKLYVQSAKSGAAALMVRLDRMEAELADLNSRVGVVETSEASRALARHQRIMQGLLGLVIRQIPTILLLIAAGWLQLKHNILEIGKE